MTGGTIDTARQAERPAPTVVVAAAIQFFFSLQATLLFPLGPVLASDLHFSVAKLGYLNAAFLTSACVTGVLGALILDSFDRRRAIGVTLAGVALCAGLTGTVHDLSGLVAIRLLSGVFGGPLIALALATISDAVPPEKRGAALGAVSRGSALALVAGVPVSLVMAEALGWRPAMAVIGGLGMLFALAAVRWLPHRLNRPQPARLKPLLRDFAAILSRRSTALAMLFNSLNSIIVLVLAANIAPFLVGNLGFAEGSLKYVWALGGACALVGTTLFGRIGDRLGGGASVLLLLGGSIASYGLMFIAPWLPVPFAATFLLYSIMGSGRVVVTNLILARVPSPDERGRFFSLVSAVAQAATAAAIFAASQLLVVGPGNRLENIAGLGWAALLAALGAAALGLWLDRIGRFGAAPGHPRARDDASIPG